MDTPEAPRLLDRVRDRIRLKHYSIRTEQAYSDWIKRFIRFHGKRHPADLGATEVEIFLTHLAVERCVAASTQNQAKSALLFLYGEVLGVELPRLDGVEKAKAPMHLPVVLTPEEVSRVLMRLQGTHRLIGRLLYGTGLRIMEALRLRTKDVEFSRREILVRDGKGSKDRVTMLPQGIAAPLRRHLVAVQMLHQEDLKAGFGSVWPAVCIGAQISECRSRLGCVASASPTSKAMPRRRCKRGNTAAAFPWTPWYASRPPTGRDWSDCCATASARRSRWNGCSNAIPSTCATRPANPAPAAVARSS